MGQKYRASGEDRRGVISFPRDPAEAGRRLCVLLGLRWPGYEPEYMRSEAATVQSTRGRRQVDEVGNGSFCCLASRASWTNSSRWAPETS